MSEEGSAHRGGQVDAIVIYFPAVDYNITQADGIYARVMRMQMRQRRVILGVDSAKSSARSRILFIHRECASVRTVRRLLVTDT